MKKPKSSGALPTALFSDHSHLSPHFKTDDLLRDPSLARKVDVLEDQVEYWLLRPAATLLATEHGERSALSVCSVYFELIACYLKGEESDGRSKQFFRIGLFEVFPEMGSNQEVTESALEEVATSLYGDLRCGLFHIGLLRPRILLMPVGACTPILDSDTVKSILIDPHLFLHRIRHHFQKYLTHLRNADRDSLHANFERLWDTRFLVQRSVVMSRD